MIGDSSVMLLSALAKRHRRSVGRAGKSPGV